MCGIAGFTAPGLEAKSILAAMNVALAHRGPDGAGIFVDRTIALGHTRLAIIDPAGGAQPRVDEASGDALVFNGEIYGYKGLADELRASGVMLRDRSDTEVLFQLIRRDGLRGALARIDGMFAFAFRDGTTGALHLVRDRVGEKPLYYALTCNGAVFASEVCALMRHPALRDIGPDRLAAYSFLLFEYLPGRLSGWEGIEKLEPGTIITFCDGTITRERYWRPRIVSGNPHGIDVRQAVERLDALLRESVWRRLIADVPVGVFLSGGIDSSLITALAVQQAPRITAFTVSVEGESFDETPHAVAVARHLGVRHELIECAKSDLIEAFDAVSDKLSEPLGDSSLLPTYLVCRAARQLMTVGLAGDGADELFAGYPNFALQRLAPAMRLLPGATGRLLARAAEALPGADGYMNLRFQLRQLSQGLGAETARQSFLWMAPVGPADMKGLWRQGALPPHALASAFAPIEERAANLVGLSAVDKLLQLFLETYLPEDILTKTDRASMFNSLEVRAPFLDRDVVEFALGLPTSHKLVGLKRKVVLKHVAERYLPERIIHRKKHGFAAPIGELMRTVFRERCADVLLSRRNAVAQWFDRTAIERLLAEHNAGRRDHGKKLWSLYILFRVAAHRTAALATSPALAQTVP